MPKKLPKPYGYRDFAWPYFPENDDGSFNCRNKCGKKLASYGVCSKECKVSLEKKEKDAERAAKKREEKRRARKLSEMTVGEFEDFIKACVSNY